jgi:hypothetical protein
MELIARINPNTVTRKGSLTHNIHCLTTDRFDETLHIRSGAIQAALNLDFSGTGDYNALGIFFGM